MFKFRIHLILAAATTAAMLASTGAHAGSQENFIAADRNGDKMLNRSEFRVFINKNAAEGISPAPMIQSQNMYNEAFDMVDRNGDGLFSVDEAVGTATTDWTNVR